MSENSNPGGKTNNAPNTNEAPSDDQAKQANPAKLDEPILVDERSEEEIQAEEVEAEELEALLNSGITLGGPALRSPPLKELLTSTDPPSKFVTYLAIGFAVLALTCVGLLVSRYLDMKRSQKPVETKTQTLQPEKIITETLGEFRLVLKGADHPTEGELRVDVVAECTNEEACLYLKDHLAQARDIVIPVLINARREDLLNPDGKTLIRKRITEQLNSLPMNGKIIQVLFTDLTIE